MDNAYNILKQQMSMPKATTERSGCVIFGELVAKRLEKLEPNERDYVMNEIENVMYRAKISFGKKKKFKCIFFYTTKSKLHTGFMCRST